MSTSFAPSALDEHVVAETDTTGQLSDVRALGGHLRDALARVDAAHLPASRAYGELVVAGMGGSAAGGRLAVAALGRRLRRPMAVSDGYALPGWVGEETVVLCSSYSGNTEETLEAYEDAGRRGAARIVATTGGELGRRAERDRVPSITLPTGFQPRAT